MFAKRHRKNIVLNEPEDNRVFEAAKIILRKKIANLTIVKTKNSEMKCKMLEKLGATIVTPKKYVEEFSKKLYEIRNGKINLKDAKKLILNPNYFGVMLVKEGLADGLVSGAAHPTSDTLRPAFQILRSNHKASGAFLMKKQNKYFIFADCAVNINPTEEDLAYIAYDSVKTAKMLKITPRVAFLSYSTNGSGKGAEKVRNAWKLFKKFYPKLSSCGEIQADAALNKNVRKIKWKNCPLDKDANVLIFPDLNSGNISYKLVQRLAGFESIGPIIQGLEKPVNDLSRGCSIKEIVDLVAITSIQAL